MYAVRTIVKGTRPKDCSALELAMLDANKRTNIQVCAIEEQRESETVGCHKTMASFGPLLFTKVISAAHISPLKCLLISRSHGHPPIILLCVTPVPDFDISLEQQIHFKPTRTNISSSETCAYHSTQPRRW
jgi:hypothetical protein